MESEAEAVKLITPQQRRASAIDLKDIALSQSVTLGKKDKGTT